MPGIAIMVFIVTPLITEVRSFLGFQVLDFLVRLFLCIMYVVSYRRMADLEQYVSRHPEIAWTVSSRKIYFALLIYNAILTSVGTWFIVEICVSSIKPDYATPFL